MSKDNLKEIKELPLLEDYPVLKDALENRELVIFIGAGVSRLLGCKSWDDLATDLLKKCLELKLIDYYEFEEIKKYPSDEVYCIGGDSIYKQLLPYCDMAHVTKIDFAYAADSYFPNLDELPEWHVAAESEEQTYFDLEYKFVRYERTKK